ncbi:DUF92 domain-containing protein [Vagococcus fluvialis]|uniref:DUF92 domain-containing protein n=1 Tax=Vagococcus fluvialis TaxID=2738 RepID=UPI003B597A61
MTIFLLAIGLIGSTLLSLIGYHFKAISFDGIFTTIITGTIIALSGNLAIWSSIIFLFGSSLAIKLFKSFFFPASLEIEKQVHEKLSARDSFQILANTLPATLCIITYLSTNNTTFVLGYLASTAAASADTWASELGILSKRKTFDLKSFKPVPKGISGGVSFLGTLASLAASCCIVFVFYFFNFIKPIPIDSKQYLIIIIIGFSGSLIDSFIGSFFQGLFRDNNQELTDKKEHNQLVKGFTWLNNDGVNIITNLIITTLALIIL